MSSIKTKKEYIRSCSFPDCGKPHNALGLCHGHWAQQKKGKELTPLKTPGIRKTPGAICAVDSCNNLSNVRGFCNAHYSRLRISGDLRPDVPIIKRQGKRGKGYINKDGYRVISINNKGDILEHRFIMAQILGRPLFKDENVHHINGIRSDNRPENLELWSTSQPQGQRVEDKLAWAHEIINRYENQL